MSKDLIYLDYAATTPLRPAARMAMRQGFDLVGNPSSVHRAGRAARDAIDGARQSLSSALDVGIGQIVFTSGGTEANAIAMTQVDKPKRFCSAIEHEAVLAWVSPENLLPVDATAALNLDAADSILSRAQPGLVSLMLVNNTLGSIQPVKALSEIARKYGHLVHCDAVQALGKIPISFAELGVDFLTVSAHKIGGPKGVGALIVRDGYPLQSFTHGGGQERRRRPGTENLYGILGFGGAISDLDARLNSLGMMEQLNKKVVDAAGDGAVIVDGGLHVPHILSLHMPGVKSQLQLMRFDLAGICVSAGSACSSGKVADSYVIKAMGLSDDVAGETVRVSFGPETTDTDVDAFLTEWATIRASVRSAA